MKATSPVVPTIRALVKALRGMGYDVRASAIVDVGEGPNRLDANRRRRD